MKPFLFSILFLLLAPSFLHAQGAPVRKGDVVDIRLSSVPPEEVVAFNGSYTIDDDGNINLPMIRQVKVAGLLPNQIQEAIENKLVEQKIYTHPTIVVQLSVARLVNVMGEVKAPGRINFTSDMTLMTAIGACGGFTDYAEKKNIQLVREGKSTSYNAKEISKNPTLDPKVLPGDQIVIKQSFF